MTSRASLAFVSWHLGDLHRARQLIEEAIGLGNELSHLPSTAFALNYKILIEGLRNDLKSVLAEAENLLRVSQQHGMKYYVTAACVSLSWARGRMGDARRGAEELRNLLAAYTNQGMRLSTPWLLGFIGELEAAAGDADGALALIDEGVATALRSGERLTDSYLHRLRGDVLLKRKPVDPAPAEDAYRTAIDIAKQQGARSYGLLASLALAKLYQSTGRALDAHAVLAPALEGFSPTPELPEIAEAQALMGRLAQGGFGR